MISLAAWLTIGLIGFLLARKALHLEFGVHPFTIGTMLVAALLMWGGPLMLIFAAQFWVLWLTQGKGDSRMQRVFNTPVADIFRRSPKHP